jgi:hypothetical protein
VIALAVLFTLAVLCGVRAGDGKPSDEGKAAKFKGKTFDLKEKGEAAIQCFDPRNRCRRLRFRLV